MHIRKSHGKNLSFVHQRWRYRGPLSSFRAKRTYRDVHWEGAAEPLDRELDEVIEAGLVRVDAGVEVLQGRAPARVQSWPLISGAARNESTPRVSPARVHVL